MTRTTALLSLLLGTGIAGATACSGGVAEDATAGTSALGERPDDAKAAADRARCVFGRGALPSETLGKSSRIGADMPIDTIIVLMQENRSFDSYFARLGAYAHRDDIEVAPLDTTNPAHTGGDPGAAHKLQHAPHLCFTDTNHEWKEAHLQFDNGKMDGFFETNEGFSEMSFIPKALRGGDRALWYYDERDLPFYYELASTFGIADHYHSSLIGPTYPNRMFLYSATSFGFTYNKVAYPARRIDDPSPKMIFDSLTDKGVSWNIYKDGLFPGVAVVNALGAFDRWDHGRIRDMGDFFDDAKNGTLPHVVFIDGSLGEAGPDHNDEHPPADVQVGQRFVADVVNAVLASPQWPHTAFFLTYDENGGIYDHVAPPAACAPDDTAPIKMRGDSTVAGFDRLGMRVPFIVVSPYVKARHVSHVTYDHTSITRFIEARFEIEALTRRDANADPLLDFFDFDAPAFTTPPRFVRPAVDDAELSYCRAKYRRPPPDSHRGPH